MEIHGLQFDTQILERVHSTPETECMHFIKEVYPNAQFVEVPDGRQLIYVDRGSNILGIAHLDGTMPATHFAVGHQYNEDGSRDPLIFSPFVDDRSGVYTLLFLLPQLGITTDLLFSVGEEIGNPTSQFFKPTDKQYRWMYQFDRKGTDAVCYQYNGKEWLDALTEDFGTIYVGAFSDISYMYRLGCMGVNIGTGYHNYTNPGGWTNLRELTEQVYKFSAFFGKRCNTSFPFDAEAYIRMLMKRNAKTQRKFIQKPKGNHKTLKFNNRG